jgi:hypothetical protein
MSTNGETHTPRAQSGGPCAWSCMVTGDNVVGWLAGERWCRRPAGAEGGSGGTGGGEFKSRMDWLADSGPGLDTILVEGGVAIESEFGG